jgi:5-methylcytosine-specific restriction endonuclease McrA
MNSLEYRAANRDKFKIWQRRYYERNRDKIILRQREYKATHPEYVAKQNRNHSRPHDLSSPLAIEARRASYRRFYQRNKSKWKVYQAVRIARHKGAVGSFRPKQWEELKAKFGNVCLCCRQEKPLEIDHVVPLSRGGGGGIDNIQPLCGICNRKKGTKVIDYRPSG